MGQVTVRFEDEKEEAVMLRNVKDLFKKKHLCKQEHNYFSNIQALPWTYYVPVTVLCFKNVFLSDPFNQVSFILATLLMKY